MTGLDEYIEACRDVPFDWGIHDCLTFADGALAVQTGKGFGVEIDYSSPMRAATALKKYLAATNHKDLPAALDGRLTRLETNVPPKGSIVARKMENNAFEYALGVVLTHRAAFVSPDGLTFQVVKPTDQFWGVS